MIENVLEIVGELGFGFIEPDVRVTNHYLEDTILFIELTNGQILNVDISKYIGEITETKINAIETMAISIENGELIFDYDDSILEFNFSLENNDLIVDDNDENVDFNINENNELEVAY